MISVLQFNNQNLQRKYKRLWALFNSFSDDCSTQTRLPSNLRSTTRECVNLVSHGHFRPCNKDGGHTIRSVRAENPMLHVTQTSRLFYIEPELWAIEVLHCGNRDFRLFLLWPWPWPDQGRPVNVTHGARCDGKVRRKTNHKGGF